MVRKPTEIVQLKVRLTEEMRRKLLREAKKRNRSLNSEIAARLEQSLDPMFTKDEMFAFLKKAIDASANELKAPPPVSRQADEILQALVTDGKISAADALAYGLDRLPKKDQ